MRRFLAVAGALLATGLGVFFVGGGSSSSGGAVGIGRIQRFGARSVPRATAAACVPVTPPSGTQPLSPNVYTSGWSLLNAGVVVPVLTAAATTGPDCVAASAQRIDLPTVSAAQFSGVYQASGCVNSGGNQDQSIYLKGVSGSGSIDLCTFAAAPNCVQVAFTATAWAKVSRDNVSTGGTGDFFFGYDGSDTGGVGGAAVSFYAWGADCVDHAP